ncbi:hypothetical protein L3Q82_002902 [Scortum barcoo]|uniref:Uncharacterized protein n=1 Tax=Scortum barcoo TaxID=214431 RepID=A0ACB8VV73_9TELE|nr:hypothetical protein L3Q82_002902 [Scortum barcoo]
MVTAMRRREERVPQRPASAHVGLHDPYGTSSDNGNRQDMVRHLPNEACKIKLAMYDGQVAIRYVCSLPEHIREDYTLLKEQLTQRFAVKDPPTTVRRKLGELRQGKESAAEFAEGVQCLLGRTTKRGPSLQIKVTVNGLPIKAVVDTGAEDTVISEEVYNMLPTETQKPLTETSLRNAGLGSKMSAMGKLEVTLEIGSLFVGNYSPVPIPAQQNFSQPSARTDGPFAAEYFGPCTPSALLGHQKKFLLRTDHNSLTWLVCFKHPEGQLARWLEELSQYDFEIEHRAGRQHANADTLSRCNTEGLTDCDCYQAGKEATELPCQECSHCQRLHDQWIRFEEDVDDVVPLAIRQITIKESENSPEPQQVEADHHASTGTSAPLTCQQLSSAQKEDPVLSILHRWKESGVLPTREQEQE